MSEDLLHTLSFPSDDQACIDFHAEDVDFILPGQDDVVAWIKSIIAEQGCTLGFLNVIFCSDEHLYGMNVTYLDHDTLTDIITFPYAPPPKIEGDIFISIDRVQENAQAFNVSFLHELHRVIIHGVLHLCGQDDKTAEEKGHMRAKEDEALVKMKLSNGK